MVIFGRRKLLDELWWIVQASRLDIFSLHSFRSWNVFEPVRLFYLSCCEYTHTQNTFDAVCLSKNNSCYWFRRRTEIVLRIANWMEGFFFLVGNNEPCTKIAYVICQCRTVCQSKWGNGGLPAVEETISYLFCRYNFFFAHLHHARMAIPPSTELIQ